MWVRVYRPTSSLSAHRQHKNGKTLLNIEGLSCNLNLKGHLEPQKQMKPKKERQKKNPLPLLLDLSVSPQLCCFYCSAKLLHGCQATWLQHYQSPACQPSAAVLIDLGSRAYPAKRAAARASPSLFFIFSPLDSPKKKKHNQKTKQQQEKKTAEILAKRY